MSFDGFPKVKKALIGYETLAQPTEVYAVESTSLYLMLTPQPGQAAQFEKFVCDLVALIDPDFAILPHYGPDLVCDRAVIVKLF